MSNADSTPSAPPPPPLPSSLSLSDPSTSTSPMFPPPPKSSADTDSLYTIDSAIKSDLYRMHLGRRRQALNSEAWKWPADSESVKFELMLSRLWGMSYPNGLHFEPEPGMLRKILGKGGRVLDVGSGMVGDWVLKMGEMYPEAEVTGVDLSPFELEYSPPNVFFEVHDVSLGLPYFDGCFRLIHCRLMKPLFSTSLFVLKEIARCLEPGGILLIEEPDVSFSRRDPPHPLQQAAIDHQLGMATSVAGSSPMRQLSAKSKWFNEMGDTIFGTGFFDMGIDSIGETSIGVKEGADDKQIEAGSLVRDLELLIWSLGRSTFADMIDETRAALADRDREILPREDVGLFVKQKTHWVRRNQVLALPDR
ncbi:S-adenosyl-L-methionine-dependent methyltransferase [Mrakia frigida]|uniref:class I SAM-dependent methyltransferase n=1 Tax=Mrakia frigida TaxID=29902 RepID=UPI003FCC1225